MGNYLNGRRGDLDFVDRFTITTKARRRVETTKMVGGRLKRVMTIGIEGKALKKGWGAEFAVKLIKIHNTTRILR